MEILVFIFTILNQHTLFNGIEREQKKIERNLWRANKKTTTWKFSLTTVQNLLYLAQETEENSALLTYLMIEINKCSSQQIALWKSAVEIIAHAYTFSEFLYVETSRDMRIDTLQLHLNISMPLKLFGFMVFNSHEPINESGYFHSNLLFQWSFFFHIGMRFLCGH